MLDKEGNFCPDAAIRLNFAATGAVGFKAVCNGDATSLESFVRPTMLTFKGELVVVVETKSVGEGMLSVSADGFPVSEVKFTVVENNKADGQVPIFEETGPSTE